LIGRGDTIGIFQLESRLGRKYSEAIKPANIDELSDVLALIRPGCLQSSLEDGRSLTEHYVDRVKMLEEIEYTHPALESILSPTVGIMTYQEQVIAIGQKLAGMSDSDADLYLRYGIGKKKADLIERGREIFLEGCGNNDINTKDAEQIFSWVEGCARYSFNKSHSTAYAQHAYCGAYAKANHPKEFFCVSLSHCKFRGQKKDIEKRLLIQDARRHGIEVIPFSIKNGNKEFAIIDDKISVGFTDMKNCGVADWEKWRKYADENPVPNNWDEFLIYCSSYFNKTCLESLIQGGGLDCYRFSRKKMIYQFHLYKRLNDRQRNWIAENYGGSMSATLVCMIGLGSGKDKPCYNKPSLEKCEAVVKDWTNETYNTWTDSRRIELWEANIIGAPLTASRTEEMDINYAANTTCLELSDVQVGVTKQFKVLCWITRVHEVLTKKDKKKMAFVSFSDGMFEIDDGVIFSDGYNKYGHNLIEDMEVLLTLKKGSRGGFEIIKVLEV
jgi:DNA polymerase III alpha subunit